MNGGVHMSMRRAALVAGIAYLAMFVPDKSSPLFAAVLL